MPKPTSHTNTHVHCLSIAVFLLSTVPPYHQRIRPGPATPPAPRTPAPPASRPPRPPDPLRAQAAEALNHADFPTALKLLTTLADRNPTDPHILFDLASVPAVRACHFASRSNQDSDYWRVRKV